MLKIRFLIVGASAALFIGGGTALANMSAVSGSNSDSHGDAVASAARTTCPHGPGGVHGACVSAIASSKAESDNNTEDGAPDTNEDAAAKTDKRNDRVHGHSAKDIDKDPGDKAHGNSH